MVTVLPEMLRKITLGIVWGTAIVAYIQAMFLNKGLEQLGATATGFSTTMAEQWSNTILWFVIIIGAVLLVCFTKERWQKILTVSSGCLIAVQAVGMISLFLTAEEDCYKVADKGVVCLDASQ